jgi:hypothetical protein
VAIADSAKGPFVMKEHFRPFNYASRDLGMFVDDDGKVYLMYSADLRTIRMVELSADSEIPGACAHSAHLRHWMPGKDSTP